MHLRKEKNCLNCGTIVVGKYCHRCGQANIDTNIPFTHLVTEFFADLLHFDHKAFTTFKYLLLQPGRVAREYADGRRTFHINPIRLYLFMSAVFFILFFALDFNEDHTEKQWKGKDEMIHNIARNEETPLATRLEYIGRLTEPKARFSTDFIDRYKNIEITDSIFIFNAKNNAEIDSLKTKISKVAFLGSGLSKVTEEITYAENRSDYINQKFAEGLHTLPKAFFVLLPVFALLLALLYFRHKEFRFYHHAIFTLYYFCLTFLLAFFILLLAYGYYKLHWFIFYYLTVVLSIWSVVYLYFAMRNFYRQGHQKTFIKYTILNFAFSFFMFIIVSLAMLWSIASGGH